MFRTRLTIIMRRCWLHSALTCQPGLLHAQRYNFKFYGEEEGLQNQVVQVVLQDRAGFLWAGTQNGLFRYDGSRFTGFYRTDGLPAGRIDSLYESVDGTLWVGTAPVGLARRVGERFETGAVGRPAGDAARCDGAASHGVQPRRTSLCRYRPRTCGRNQNDARG